MDLGGQKIVRILSVTARWGARYLGLLLVTGVLLGCADSGNGASSGNDPLADKSFVTGQPCAAPCWYGLNIDLSTKEEVYATLRRLPFVDPSSIRETSDSWMGDSSARLVEWNCTHPPTGRNADLCGGATLLHDRLKRLWYSVGYNLSFETVVQQLGVPDYLDYGIWSEAGGTLIFLYWPNKMTLVEYLDRKSLALLQLLDQGKSLPRNTPVAAIFFGSKEGFRSTPGMGEKRIAWPGFEP